jgi:putative endonuclease
MWSVYLIRHTSGGLYFGVTNNLKRRIQEHNRRSAHGFTTRRDGMWSLVYAEVYASETDARNRELKIKQHGRAKQEILRRNSNHLLPKSGAGQK